MRVIDLFPKCLRGSNCDLPLPIVTSDGGHKHILPKQQELLDSEERYVAQVGGYGSGKTLAACVLGNLLCFSVPGNRGLVIRTSLPKLREATQRIYLEVLERLSDASGMGFRYRETRDDFPARVVYENGSEVSFRPAEDPGRFLGPEYGWFFVDEAQEIPHDVFKKLMGRLRLPLAAQYLKGMVGTNPPNKTHWIAQMWPQSGHWEQEVMVDGKKVIVTFRMIQSSTKANPFVDPEYIAGLLLSHDPSEVKRIIEGFYGFSYDGRPVYPTFRFEKHVGDPRSKAMTLIRVWDFGYHNPACTWHQMFRCKENKLHWTILHEYVPHELTAEAFALSVDPETKLPRGVLHETMTVFPNIPKTLVIDGGDTAGAQYNDKGPGPIIRLARPLADGGFNLHFKHKKFPDIDPGLDGVRRCLNFKCKCGYYLLMVHRRCVTVIEGFAGGYHYPQEKAGREVKPKPVKDGYYDNPMDTVRYAHELFYRPAARDDSALDELEQAGEPKIVMPGDDPWAWMERIRGM